ncbi:hypothetical protein A9Q97_03260 [Rhodospirillales bacterium 47_12_T64]|nr:hypothetical protein A9Q97_03260 [Rhodospirillales bacterium 47_12_T64]
MIRSGLKWHLFNFKGKYEVKAVRILGDAGMASPTISDGVLIPWLLLDTSERPDIADFILRHQHTPPGDVVSQWGKLSRFTKNKVSLILCFKNPIELNVLIDFKLPEQGILIERILQANAVFLQAGQEGDRIRDDLNIPKVIIEVPETGFRPHWDFIYKSALVKKYRKKGVSKKEATRMASDHIESIGKLDVFRLK